ncbi:MAG: TonB-dependent receptor [Reichenbachiella sp.]
MKTISLATALAFISTFSYGQLLTQTVRGTIKDLDNQSPLIGATVIVLDSDPMIGTITDQKGSFSIKDVPVGRIALNLSYLGYTAKTIPNIVVNSGKEVVLELSMQESVIKLDDIVITAEVEKGKPINDMAIVSARSISPEETYRYPGTFNDPSRIVSKFAGVTTTQDGSNDIIVRGNAPKYVQWRLEGIQITNPNHFADQGAAGGSISTLNNNLLSSSDFYTGAFTPEFGDALSAVYDVKMRAGNNEKLESVFGFGLLGTDITVEGPFKSGYGGSFLANYRYSTVSIIDDLGLVDISGVPKFQDAAFKIVLPTKSIGTFSLFGLGGISSFSFEDVTPDIWETPGDRFMRTDITEDYDKKSHLLNLGINHTMSLGKNNFLNTTLSYSSEYVNDEITESGVVQLYDDMGDFVRDSIVSTRTNYQSTMEKFTYRAALTYHHKINARHKFQIGTKLARTSHSLVSSQFQGDSGIRFTAIDFNENIKTVRNFISWQFRLNEHLTLVSGFHNMNVLLNNKSTIEPRIALNWQLNPSNAVKLGYGQHSTMESIHHYFARVEQSDGSVIEPNRDLDLLKAHHFVLGYEKRFNDKMRLNVELYYQSLYDLPVANSDTSHFATINEGVEFQYIDLVNEGTGYNYGIELTLERYFSRNYYYMLNASVFDSKYKSLENIERNTTFNSNYLVNVLVGKEFVNLGKKRNQILGLNASVFIGGGKKIIPLLRDAEGNLAVDPENDQYWDYGKAYDDQLDNIYRVTVSANYKWNKPKATHELLLTLDNVTDNLGRISEYYDESQPNSIGYLTQFGFFPNLMYKVYF